MDLHYIHCFFFKVKIVLFEDSKIWVYLRVNSDNSWISSTNSFTLIDPILEVGVLDIIGVVSILFSHSNDRVSNISQRNNFFIRNFWIL